MHTLAKRIDTQINILESKVSNPMNMMYSDNSSQGVKVLSMLHGIIENLDTKKVPIKRKLKFNTIIQIFKYLIRKKITLIKGY